MRRQLGRRSVGNSFLVLALLLSMLGAAAAQVPGGRPDPAQADLAAGRAIYGQYCSSCHGANGEGAPGWQMPDVRGELPAPAHNATGHTWRHADAALYEMVSEGWRDPFNRTDRQTMPAFGDRLSAQEIRAVISYLKTLWTAEQRQAQAEASKDRPFPPGSP